MLIHDDVSNPIHYTGDGKIQCKHALKSMFAATPMWMSGETNYWWGCAFKYIWRWPNKNRIKDIDKAIQCLKYMRDSAIEDIADQHGFDLCSMSDDEIEAMIR